MLVKIKYSINTLLILLFLSNQQHMKSLIFPSAIFNMGLTNSSCSSCSSNFSFSYHLTFSHKTRGGQQRGCPWLGDGKLFRDSELQLPLSAASVRQSTHSVDFNQSELRQPPSSPPLTSIFLRATQRLAAPFWKRKKDSGNVEKSPPDTMLYLEDYLESEFGVLPRLAFTQFRTLSAPCVSFSGPRLNGR